MVIVSNDILVYSKIQEEKVMHFKVVFQILRNVL